MKVYSLEILTLICVAIVTASTNTAVNRYVISLTKDNIEKTVKENDFVFVRFYSKSCEKCIPVAEQFELAAEEIKKYPEFKHKVVMAEFNIDDSKDLAEKYGVGNDILPVLRFFTSGEQEEYQKAFHAVNIQAYLDKKMGMDVKDLINHQEVEEYRKHFDCILVFVGHDEEKYRMFNDLARPLQDVPLAACADESCIKEYKVENGSTIVLRNFGETHFASINTDNEDEYNDFLRWNLTPPISVYNDRINDLIFGKGTPALIFFREVGTIAEKYFNELTEKVAPKLKGRVLIIISDVKNGWDNRIAEYVGAKLPDLPAIRLMDTRTEDYKKYKLSGEQTEETVLDFVKKWEQGQLEVFKKSQPLPDATKEATANIKTVVGQTFTEMVNKPNKHVLIAFYDPWCEKSLHLAGIYHYLHLALKDTNPDIELQKFDYPNNDPENLVIYSIPFVKLYKIGEKDHPIDFEGERTLTNIVAFLQKHIPGFKAFKVEEPNFDNPPPAPAGDGNLEKKIDL